MGPVNENVDRRQGGFMIRFTGVESAERRTNLGVPFKVWREVPEVPRLDDKFLDCSIYLYPSEGDAKRGERIGGSGFLAAVPGKEYHFEDGSNKAFATYYHLYAVSNRHVIQKNPVARLNTHKGEFAVFPLVTADWTAAPDQDVAVAPISYDAAYKFLCISTEYFVTPELAAKQDIGIGDEVFMVGRLVNHEGKQRNLPSVRWGHVSMMPDEPVFHESNAGQRQESFLVEVHSVSGYSGSPVFVRPFWTRKVSATHYPVTNTVVYTGSAPYYPEVGDGKNGPWLLGVDWGYINNHDQRQNNTGMSGVVPAWRVLDLLNLEKFQKQRAREEEEMRRRHEQGGTTLTPSGG